MYAAIYFASAIMCFVIGELLIRLLEEKSTDKPSPITCAIRAFALAPAVFGTGYAGFVVPVMTVPVLVVATNNGNRIFLAIAFGSWLVTTFVIYRITWLLKAAPSIGCSQGDPTVPEAPLQPEPRWVVWVFAIGVLVAIHDFHEVCDMNEVNSNGKHHWVRISTRSSKPDLCSSDAIRMRERIAKHFSRTGWAASWRFVAAIALASLAGCDGPNQTAVDNGTFASSVTAMDHDPSDTFVRNVYVDGTWVGEGGRGGKTVLGGITLPRRWHPGLTAVVRWERCDRFDRKHPVPDEKACRWTEKIVPIHRYEAVGGTWLHLLENEQVLIIPSMLGPGHPDYPGPDFPKKDFFAKTNNKDVHKYE